MAIYVKLGKKAEVFSDPISDVSVSGKQVAEITRKQANSPMTANALKGGHLVRATKAEYLAFVKRDKKAQEVASSSYSANTDEKTIKHLKKVNTELLEKNNQLEEEISKLKEKIDELENPGDPENEEIVDFDEMEGPELVDYYENTYEVDEKQLAAFKKLSVKARREKLEELEIESQEEEEEGDE